MAYKVRLIPIKVGRDNVMDDSPRVLHLPRVLIILLLWPPPRLPQSARDPCPTTGFQIQHHRQPLMFMHNKN
jgi:hypothetical protein